jgi:hypothetical protein
MNVRMNNEYFSPTPSASIDNSRTIHLPLSPISTYYNISYSFNSDFLTKMLQVKLEDKQTALYYYFIELYLSEELPMNGNKFVERKGNIWRSEKLNQKRCPQKS